MKRRKFLKALTVLPAAAAIPQWAQQVSPQVGKGTPENPVRTGPAGQAISGNPATSPRSSTPPLDTVFFEDESASVPTFFTPDQYAALRRLSDRFMPPMNGKPGALQAGAPEFVDFYTSVSLPERQQFYRAGLDNLNDQARAKFNKRFADLTDAQTDQILKPMFKPRGSSGGVQAVLELGPFVNRAYQDIRTVTINSPAWAENAKQSGIAVLSPLTWNSVDPTLPLYHQTDAIDTSKRRG
jgi:Gluconate 2-dehydrogenase subunit 3